MQHFDMESTVFERGGSLLYISVKKTFLTFFPMFAYISLSVIDNMVPFYTDAHRYIMQKCASSQVSTIYIECADME